MENPTHPDLERLMLLLQDIGRDGREAIGLLPMSSLRHCGYLQAPKNSLSFAHTGANGNHFSLLAL
jgi:hypothetical protein